MGAIRLNEWLRNVRACISAMYVWCATILNKFWDNRLFQTNFYMGTNGVKRTNMKALLIWIKYKSYKRTHQKAKYTVKTKDWHCGTFKFIRVYQSIQPFHLYCVPHSDLYSHIHCLIGKLKAKPSNAFC